LRGSALRGTDPIEMRLLAPTALIAALALPVVARAQPKPALPAVVGATEVVRFTTPSGFIDDPVALDGRRVAYAIVDGTAHAELHVVELATKQDAVIDISAVTFHPIDVRLLGARALVIGATDDGNQVAALVELADAGKTKPAGTVVYRVGPATHITAITRDGALRLAVHRATATQTGTRHEVELLAVDSGRRVAGGRALELDRNDTDVKLELHVNHWADGMTRAFGIKGGEWDPKENQRSPNVEAQFDLVAGKIVDKKPIGDLFEQRKRYGMLADAGGKLDFVRMSWDNTGVELWRAGKPVPLELDQPIASYDPKSLQSAVDATGGGYLAFKVDPVNAAAVERKKADPEYFDIFKVDGAKATRRARVLATGARHRFGVLGDTFYLLERSTAFDRGGRTLTLYRLGE